jgi:two-component system response regulator
VVVDSMEEEVAEVLLVEDNPYDAQLLMSVLRGGEFRCNLHWVNGGMEAIEFLFGKDIVGSVSCQDRASTLSLILLDLKMPQLDGLEVLKRIRSNAQTKITPIVILTSSFLYSDMLASYEAGANSFVVKPVQFEAYNKSIKQLIAYWTVLNKLPKISCQPLSTH